MDGLLIYSRPVAARPVLGPGLGEVRLIRASDGPMRKVTDIGRGSRFYGIQRIRAHLLIASKPSHNLRLLVFGSLFNYV